MEHIHPHLVHPGQGREANDHPTQQVKQLLGFLLGRLDDPRRRSERPRAPRDSIGPVEHARSMGVPLLQFQRLGVCVGEARQGEREGEYDCGSADSG
jgi:hypothetical protein